MAIDYTGMKEEMIRALLKEEREKEAREFEKARLLALYREKEQAAEQERLRANSSVVRIEYDYLNDCYIEYRPNGMRETVPLNKKLTVPAAYVDTYIDTMMAKPEVAKPVVEKSSEELMDDALDAAVRAARKAV